jgi:endoglucanase
MIAKLAAPYRPLAVVSGLVLVVLAGSCGHPNSGDHKPLTAEAAQSPDPSPAAASGSANASPAPPAGTSAPAQPDGNPLAGYSFYVDPASPAAVQAAQWQAQGRTADARALTKISLRPVARWLPPGSSRTTGDVAAMVRRASDAHQMLLLVAYQIPGRDCGHFSAGGAASADAYRTWIRAVAAGIGNRPAIVILEPDAIPQAIEGCGGTVARDRYALLSDAVTVLKASGSVRVYLDAGHPSWITDLKALADALRQSGVVRADGFALNVANFKTTADNVSYGRRLSDQLGGTHFVIDTGRNGNGPWPDGGQVNGGPSWCNPPGRLLGPAPTTRTNLARVDALLWVKRPGDSDGQCRPGEPTAGQWWPEYALDLAKRSP